MNLDEWTKGDRVGAAKLNQSINAIKQLRQRMGGAEGPGGAVGMGMPPMLARVTTAGPNGEANYSDSRYWVKFALIDTEGSTSQPNTAILDIRDRSRSLASPTPSDASPDVVTATNLAEAAYSNNAGAHALSDGQPVWVFPVYDSADVQTKRWVFSVQPEYTRLVQVTGSASGGGKYTGSLLARPASDIPAAGNLSAAEVTSGTIETIRIVNTREVGQSTHDLASASFLPLVFVGVYLKTANDGVAVYAIDGQQWENCS